MQRTLTHNPRFSASSPHQPTPTTLPLKITFKSRHQITASNSPFHHQPTINNLNPKSAYIQPCLPPLHTRILGLPLRRTHSRVNPRSLHRIIPTPESPASTVARPRVFFSQKVPPAARGGGSRKRMQSGARSRLAAAARAHMENRHYGRPPPAARRQTPSARGGEPNPRHDDSAAVLFIAERGSLRPSARVCGPVYARASRDMARERCAEKSMRPHVFASDSARGR